MCTQSDAVFRFLGQITKDFKSANLSVSVFPVDKVCYILSHSLTGIFEVRPRFEEIKLCSS